MSAVIFNINTNYDTIPIVYSLIKSLIKINIEVKLISTDNKQEKKIKGLQFIKIKNPYFNNLAPFVLLLKSKMYVKDCKYLISVDPFTIIPVVFLGKIYKKKIFYLSLEISTKNDSRSFWAKYHYIIQNIFMKYFDKIIIMDMERCTLLRNNSSLREDQDLVFLPNSTLGHAQKKEEKFLHRKLNIDHDRKILLSAGELCSINRSHEIYQLSSKISKEYIIVLHSRKKANLYSQFVENSGFRLSQNPCSEEDLDLLYGSAHVGLVLYNTMQKGGGISENLHLIGKSSGKLNNFLKVGKPVIMTNLPFLKYLELEYKCGICIQSLDEFVTALEKIENDYEFYSGNAVRCFEKELCFETYFDNYIWV